MNLEIWRHVFDAIEDPVFLHDAQFCVLLANRAYCRAILYDEAVVDACARLFAEKRFAFSS